jgi:hypothetical protein
MHITINEEDYERMKDELTPLGMSGVYTDEDGNTVSVEPDDTTEVKKKPYKTSSRQTKPDRSNPNYWHQFYGPRYCGESPEEYCMKMAEKNGYRKK